MPDLYFDRVPSLPATEDGSARPPTEDLSTGSGDGEDIIRDAGAADAGEVPAEGDTASADATASADGTGSGGAPGVNAAPQKDETGRWFRPART